MALIKCPDCGKSFSDKAAACPECGCPASYAVEAASAQQKKNDEVYQANVSTVAAYELTVEQEWQHYLEYNALKNRIEKEARANAERIVDKEIEQEKTLLGQLQEKRASLKLFDFREKKEMDEQIAKQAAQIEQMEKDRRKKVTNIWLELSVGETTEGIFVQRTSELETLVKLHEEKKKAEQKLMFPAEYGWDLSVLERMSREEFEEGFQNRFIASLLNHCLEELDTVNLNIFAQYTGFSVERIEDALMQCNECDAYITRDPDTGEDIVKPREWNPALFRSSRYSSVSGRSASIPDFSRFGKNEKSASVLGRSLVGAALAGPVGALVGALSAVGKNNRRR